MIEPSSAAHRVAKLYSAGVFDEPLSATYCTVKSRVISARSMATKARSRRGARGTAYQRDEAHQVGLLRHQAEGDGDDAEDGGDQPEGDPGAAEGDVHGVVAPFATVELDRHLAALLGLLDAARSFSLS